MVDVAEPRPSLGTAPRDTARVRDLRGRGHHPWIRRVLLVLTVATSYLSYRFRRLRPLLEGEPLILIENGRVIDANLRRERLTLDEVAAEARLNQIGDLADVRYAVLETGGQISFVT